MFYVPSSSSLLQSYNESMDMFSPASLEFRVLTVILHVKPEGHDKLDGETCSWQEISHRNDIVTRYGANHVEETFASFNFQLCFQFTAQAVSYDATV